MGENYYQIRPSSDTKVNGIVVRLKDGKLECITGSEENLKKYGCGLDEKGNLTVNQDCFSTEISEEEALNLKSSYEYWTITQGYVFESKNPGVGVILPGQLKTHNL